ncbi:hypothetical protein EDD11_008137 [Mortierella claussenii]|nr:hypothetical protein EDD11_008137 [Mortierella claussenii]
MASNSLASNNAVRLGAAALVGGLVVYLIWAATSSSSSPSGPRPPTNSSSTKTTTTTVITTATTSSGSSSTSSAAKERSSASNDDPDSTDENKSRGKAQNVEQGQEVSRQRQSMDIHRDLPHTRMRRQESVEVNSVTTSIIEEAGQEEQKEEVEVVVFADREVSQDATVHALDAADQKGIDLIQEIVKAEKEEQLVAVEDEQKQSTTIETSIVDMSSREEDDWVKVEEQEQEQEQEQTQQDLPKEKPSVTSTQGAVTLETPETKQEDQLDRESGYMKETETTEISVHYTSEKLTAEEEFPGQKEAAERIEKALAIAEAASPYKSTRSLSSSTAFVPVLSGQFIAADESKGEQEEVAAAPAQINGSLSILAHQGLNTKAPVFTPSWLPNPAALVPATNTEPRNGLSASQGSLGHSQAWTLDSTLQAQSLSQLQPNDRAKMKSRCRFWPNCTNKACKFTHPSLPCRDPENCSFGDRCNFIHPKDLNRRPPRNHNNKVSLSSRKESHRQQQTNEPMIASIESLGSASSRPASVNSWNHS